MRWTGLAVAAAVLTLWAGAAGAATPACAALTALALPHVKVTAASDQRAGQITACKIEATAAPTPDSDIRIEVWIPEGAAWNGRYVQLGNGGFAGSISSAELQGLAARGYAAAQTDDGHQSADETDASWALGHPEKIIDYGWRALKETTETAKALIRSLNGVPAQYAYFDGCSDGGREALMEAQRFPTDFDGIIAGAPSASPGLVRTWTHDVQALGRPGGYLDAAALRTLQQAALAACGGGRFIADEGACRFDPSALLCPAGQTSGCLTAAQVATAEAVYRGLVGADGAVLVPGQSPGAEAEPGGWSLWLTGPSADQMSQTLLYRFAAGYWRDIVFADPELDVRTLDLTAAAQAEKGVASQLTPSADLGRFRAAGGKLIEYQGWNDPAIPARASIAYFENVRRTLGGEVGGFYRLYLIPGMLHCGGGPGPSQVAWLEVLRKWVENAQTPGPLMAAAVVTPGAPPPAAPRQLVCPYPAAADGDRCVSAEILQAPPPPPR